MKKVILYGPLPGEKIAGGYDRMNTHIIDEFMTDDQIRVIGLPILKINMKKPLKQVIYPLIYLYGTMRDSIRFINIIKRESPAILHVTALYGIFALREALMAYIAGENGIKVIYDVRAGSYVSNYQRSRAKFIYRYCLKRADKILVEGKKYEDFFNKLGYQSLYFPNYTKVLNEENQIKDNKQFDVNNLRFIYFGRVIKQKGIEESILLLLKLHKATGKKICFDIVGDCDMSYKTYILSEYEGKGISINFAGYKDQEEMKAFLKRSDFFTFLTKWKGEGHSNSLNEAMAHGLPVIFYDNGFTREIINNDMFLMDTEDSDGNVSKLNSIIDKELYYCESERLKRLVLNEYSLQKMKMDLTNIYQSLG